MTIRLIRDNTKKSAKKLDFDREPLLDNLRALLRDTFRMRNEGVAYAKLAHAQGYADGYMKMLLDAGYVTEKELLVLVSETRRNVDGPATTQVTLELTNVAV